MAVGVEPNTHLGIEAGLPIGSRGALLTSRQMRVVKIFKQVIGRTGLSDDEARREGFEPRTVGSSMNDHKAYYPGATELHIRSHRRPSKRRIARSTAPSAWGSEVSKRLDTYATAIFHGMQVNELSQLDLSYTPPLSSPWDPVQIAAQAWSANCKASMDRRRF